MKRMQNIGKDDEIGMVLLLLKNKKVRIRLAKTTIYGKKSCIKDKYSVLSGAISLISFKNC